MTLDNSTDLEPIRLLFEMTRDDNPRLFDDLLRFRKGTKRVNRLRLLAHEGLVALLAGSARPGLASPPQIGKTLDVALGGETRLAQARWTNEVFGLSESGDPG